MGSVSAPAVEQGAPVAPAAEKSVAQSSSALNGPVIHAPLPASTPRSEPQSSKPEDKPATDALASSSSEEDDGEFPFNMPDLSNIDQDIASAIQQAMRSGKKKS